MRFGRVQPGRSSPARNASLGVGGEGIQIRHFCFHA
jgi:hypothetical protein